MKFLLTILVLIALLGIACKNTKKVVKEETPKEVKFEVLRKSQYSAAEEENNFIIKDEGRWKGIWENVNQHMMPVPETPEVDFSRKMVIACFMGTKSNGGYNIAIDKVSLLNEKLSVNLIYTFPGDHCAYTEAIVHPYVFATIDKVNFGSTKFEVERKTEHCDQDGN